MKTIFTSVLLAAAMLVQAQTIVSDSVSIGAGYSKRVFYSLENGITGEMNANIWDLQFVTYKLQASTVRLNAGFGVQAWEYLSGDSADWNVLDTSGLGTENGWLRIYDDSHTYDPGAFEVTATGYPNYGWGNYNSISHDVVGYKLFVVKSRNGQYKKLFIKGLWSGTNSFEVVYANLDGSNEVNLNIARSNFNTKNFVYLNIENDSLLDAEPIRSGYELIFEKYETELSPGVYYPVTGVRAAPDVKTARVYGSDNNVTVNDTIINIGHDWKTFSGGTYVIDDSLSFLVQARNGDLYQIWFTGFSGSATGTFYFNKQKIQTASVEDALANAMEIYPNPAAEVLNINTGMQSPLTVYVIDLNGRVLMQQSFEQGEAQLRLAEAGLSTGTYVAYILTEGKAFSSKFVIR